MGRWPLRDSHRANLPVEVVLPEPWRPTIMKTLGGSLAKRSLASWLPRILISSSWTILMTCCEGESAESTSSPMALTLMFSMSCLTTRKLTSASSSAMRISRRAPSMFSAVSFPSPRRFLKTRCSLSDRLSNMRIECRHIAAAVFQRSFYYNHLLRRGCAGGRGRCGGRRRGDANAAGRHLPGAIHSKLVHDAGARTEVRGKAFDEAGNVEEDVASAVIGAEEPEALGFEIRDYRTGLFAGGGLGAGVS